MGYRDYGLLRLGYSLITSLYFTYTSIFICLDHSNYSSCGWNKRNRMYGDYINTADRWLPAWPYPYSHSTCHKSQPKAQLKWLAHPLHHGQLWWNHIVIQIDLVTHNSYPLLNKSVHKYHQVHGMYHNNRYIQKPNHFIFFFFNHWFHLLHIMFFFPQSFHPSFPFY